MADLLRDGEAVIRWFAVDAYGNILDHCEAQDVRMAEAIFAVSCPAAIYVQSRVEWNEVREERAARERNKRLRIQAEEDEDGG
jgi:hypothetical protein